MKFILVMTLVLAAFMGCKRRKTSAVKLSASIQDHRFTKVLGIEEYQQRGKFYLIHKIHSGIKIKLTLDSSCNNLADFNWRLARDLTTRSIQVWLSGFKNLANITDKTTISHPLYVPWREDVGVHYSCRSRQDGEYRSSNFGFPNGSDSAPVVTLEAKTDSVLSHYPGIKVGPFPLGVVVHEFGHAFGLADTYIYSEDWIQQNGVQAYNRSSGQTEGTVGMQVASIMSDSISFETLQPEDLKGVEWLYKYYVTGQIKAHTQCLLGYIFDDASNGCIAGSLVYKNTHKKYQVIVQTLNIKGATVRIPAILAVNQGVMDINKFLKQIAQDETASYTHFEYQSIYFIEDILSVRFIWNAEGGTAHGVSTVIVDLTTGKKFAQGDILTPRGKKMIVDLFAQKKLDPGWELWADDFDIALSAQGLMVSYNHISPNAMSGTTFEYTYAELLKNKKNIAVFQPHFKQLLEAAIHPK